MDPTKPENPKTPWMGVCARTFDFGDIRVPLRMQPRFATVCNFKIRACLVGGSGPEDAFWVKTVSRCPVDRPGRRPFRSSDETGNDGLRSSG